MIRDGAFYLKRHWRKRERKLKRTSPRIKLTFKDGTVEHAWARQYKPTSRWRWRRARAEMRKHTPEQRTSIEIAVELIWREFTSWPDDWKHRCHIGGPLGNRCSCGKCAHDVEVYLCKHCSVVAQLFGEHTKDVLAAVLPLAVAYLGGIFRRDVQ
jgi:hypothetical protein